MANLSEGEVLFCEPHWENNQQREYLQRNYSGVSVFNIFLAINTIVGNTLIFIALYKESSLHPPSKHLLYSLASTDLCVGLISQPILTVLIWSSIGEHLSLCRFAWKAIFVSGTIFSGVSLATLTAISVDRLMALLLGLRYRQVVTLRRVRNAVFCFWLKSAGIGVLYICSERTYFIISSVLILLDVTISSYCYIRIFRILRGKVRQIQRSNIHSMGTRSIAQYRKTVLTALWMHFTLAMCYLPFAATMTVVAATAHSPSMFLAASYAVCFVNLNSALNPLLYLWKIKEVRKAVKKILGQLFCLSNHIEPSV